jgi:acetyl esterase/lipase
MDDRSQVGTRIPGVIELWPPEVEAERAEARQVVAAGIAGFRDFLRPPGELPGDPLGRVRHQREHVGRNLFTVPEARDREIAGVRCRVLVPERSNATAVYLHFHGGGMIMGVPEMNDVPNRELTRTHGMAVVSVDYRLAPEHPWPAGPDDGVAVAAWLLEHAEREFGTRRLVIGGESAGGYMSAAVLLRVRDELRAADRFLGANLVFGVYDWGRSASQRGILPHDGPDVLAVDDVAFITDCYLPGRTDEERRDPAISPAFADLRGLPPALMSVGTCDHLLDDTLILASRWAVAGNPVELFVAPDMPHGFLFFPCALTRRFAAVTERWFSRILTD